MTDFDKIRRDYSMPDIARKAGVALQANGNEFEALCPVHGEKTPSFRIYQSKKGWTAHCFGCGWHGDNVDLVEELYRVDKFEAVRIITGEDGRQPAPRTAQSTAVDPYAGYQIVRPPEDEDPILPGKRTPPILNPKRIDLDTGKPKAVVYTPTEVYPYRGQKGHLLGYVLRVEFDGRKVTPGVWWTKGPDYTGWAHGKLPTPKPMYGLDLLAAAPTKQVLLVEGEKCADRANAVLGHMITGASWPGGGKSAHKVNWKPLAKRSVLCWPDNDEEGHKTFFGWKDEKTGQWRQGIIEFLHEIEAKVKVVHITPDSRPQGWDIADAIDKDGLDAQTLQILIRGQIQEWTPERHRRWRKEQITPPKVKEEPEEEEPSRAVRVLTERNWRDHLIWNKDNTAIKPTSLQNATLMMQYEPTFAGIFAWNDFAKEVTLMRRPPWDVERQGKGLSAQASAKWSERLMKDTDVTSAAGWLEYCGLTPRRNDVGAVISRIAEHNRFNPVTEALDRLEWDGVKRISPTGRPWLTYYMGAEPTVANQKFGEKWLIGAIARAYQPGCKMDNMLILEGKQGLQKSTALKVLSDAVTPGVFTDEISDPGSKDAGLQMQGSWIVEIAELDAFRSAEVTTLKAWLARTEDRFRRPYGRVVEAFPRSCVMAGTVNPSGVGYLKDVTGGRRFWPVFCSAIDLDALRREATQIWAEAKAMYMAGTPWWFTKDEEHEAWASQAARAEEDPWEDLVDIFLRGRTSVTVREIMDSLEIAKERRNATLDRRVKHALHRAGWRPGADRTFVRNSEEGLI